MNSFAVSSVSSRPLCRSATVQKPAARSSVVLCAARQQEQKKENKIGQVAAAGLAALFIAAAPVMAADTDSQSLRAKICATNPTSKICLLNSAKK